MLCNDNHDKGMKCQSGGTGPAQSAVTIKTAIAALKGEKIPQAIALPTSISYSPYKVGEDVFPELSGQLLHRQQLPGLQDRLHRSRKSRPRPETTTSHDLDWRRRGRQSRPVALMFLAGGEALTSAAAPLLRMEAITKSYGGVRALEDVQV